MNTSNTNNHFFLKAFLLFAVVFTFSTSADFKFSDSPERGIDVVSFTELRQQTNAVLVSFPKLPLFKVNYSFGLENDFFFGNFGILQETFINKKTKSNLKLLTKKYLHLKEKAETKAFLTIFHQHSDIPGNQLA